MSSSGVRSWPRRQGAAGGASPLWETGSGLGLAIAGDMFEACGRRFAWKRVRSAVCAAIAHPLVETVRGPL
ncbi:protein of unknown function [Methylocella tundrae]|uniref:Uncharacterized protein n=1 Tax=Methylocella tundrae TaxID=227605 RepID=A0A4U8Z6A3_METTU|nr:protein of unknown function [Methylocella tundrae]